MNIHLITYLTSKLFWIYIVFRYNTILYPQNEDTQKLFAYFCAYLLSCWGSMQWGTMYGDLIFELIALLIITVAYQADWQHHVWNTLMVYIMGILCDGIPIVFFQRYAVARNPVHHHMGPGTIVMGNFIFFLLEVIIERKKLRQMDREDFLEERRYREHLDETMQDMDSIKEKDSELFARDVKELLDHIGDKRIYELLKETEHQTLEILLLSTWGYSGREVAKIMGMAEQTIYTKRNRLRKKLKNLSKIE